MSAIRLLIVDDHVVVRRGLQTFFGTEPGLEVVGEAGNGREAVVQAERLHPDVVLMDLVMPEMDGIAATAEIKKRVPEVEIIALTSFIEDEKVFAALKAGATGYLLKDADPDDVVRAIEAAHAGEVQLDPRVAKRLMQEFTTPPVPAPEDPDALTDREIEVLRLIAQGLSNKEIGDRLVVSPATAKTHVSNILSKIGLASRTQAAIYALREGFITLEEAWQGNV
ncbi:MAG TPA: DNA-binding response regulator [Chloroflexi bacterium]|nr:DNA-binding response regulator [Chloroflexota bacterium]